MDRYDYATVITCSTKHWFLSSDLFHSVIILTDYFHSMHRRCVEKKTISTGLNPRRLSANSDAVCLKVQRIIPFQPAGG